ncbi:S8 family peptidase [Bacillus thuringiensis]|uniref:S8 family peptidase n=1 Tax=Bacillus thuringiensis TaxID=1428 RepID=UPI000D03D9A0|nr:S8 family serine peptidase [Bacillus thuringiensis]PRT27435.1 peptidase S8 [Bacillus thuringiensis]
MKKIIFLIAIFFAIIGSSFVQGSTTFAQADNHIYYTVLLKEGDNTDNFINNLKQNNNIVDITYTVPEIGLIQIQADKKKIEEIKQDPLVEEVNQSIGIVNSRQISNDVTKLQMEPNKPSVWDLQWDVREVTHDGKSYEEFTGTHNVVVGIIDSGIDVNHPDLAKNILSGSKNLVPKGGYRGMEESETGDINYLDDKRGHGTHTAGLIAANGLMKGVAPGIGVRAYRVFGGKSAEPIWIAKAIIEAAKDDVDVINLSLGSYLVDGTIYSKEGASKKEAAEIKAYKKAIKYAKKQGSVVVAAAGNDGIDVTNYQMMDKLIKERLLQDDLTYKGMGLDVPASLSNVITVGSTGPTQELSLFSNYGLGFSDLTAPGGDLRLFNKFGSDAYMKEGWFRKEQVISTRPRGGYYYGAGTSTAAPKVSGALALIIDKYKFKNSPNEATRELYKYGVNKTPLDALFFGKGKLDIYNAINH